MECTLSIMEFNFRTLYQNFISTILTAHLTTSLTAPDAMLLRNTHSHVEKESNDLFNLGLLFLQST